MDQKRNLSKKQREKDRNKETEKGRKRKKFELCSKSNVM